MNYRGLWLFLLFLAMLPLSAQGSVPEAVTALEFGHPVFEPELWRVVSVTEQDLRTQVHWEASRFGALAFLDYLHFEDGLVGPEVKAYFDAIWFTETLADYEQYWRVDACQLGDMLVFDFALRFSETKYVMRYWVIPVSDIRIAAFFILFPARQAALLTRYAERFNPDASACP